VVIFWGWTACCGVLHNRPILVCCFSGWLTGVFFHRWGGFRYGNRRPLVRFWLMYGSLSASHTIIWSVGPATMDCARVFALVVRVV